MKNKYPSKLCNNKMTFDDCENTILQYAIKETTNIKGKKQVNNPDVQKMLDIVEKFIINKKLICYGGTAINNILPQYAQFYKKDIEIPDYDFYSYNALDDAKELANIYYQSGYKDVEAKSGVHKGTFKVFVNFIPIADITFLEKEIYNNILSESIKIAGIHYCPPNFLRMGMYLELSRPEGDVSRWEKVHNRLNLLNYHYPITACNKKKTNKQIDDKLYNIICNTLINQNVIFFGGYAYNLYKKADKQNSSNNVCFDVINEDFDKISLIITEQLESHDYKNIKINNYKPIGELIPEHIEILVNKTPVLYVYKPIACHNYNKIKMGPQLVNIATIDTILSFYLAFMYVSEKHFDKDRLLCMSKFLFDLSEKNKLETKGLLKRYSMDCYGYQKTLIDMRSQKTEQFKKLKHNKDSKEYETWFLNYVPFKIDNKTLVNKNSIINENSEIVLKKNSKVLQTKTKTNTKTNTKSKTMKKTPIINKLFNL